MKKDIKTYSFAQKNLLRKFGCDEDFFVKVLTDKKWKIENIDGVAFFSYWEDEETRVDAVVASKNGAPQTYEKEDYTMVIAIDCIKIAFIMKNNI